MDWVSSASASYLIQRIIRHSPTKFSHRRSNGHPSNHTTSRIRIPGQSIPRIYGAAFTCFDILLPPDPFGKFIDDDAMCRSVYYRAQNKMFTRGHLSVADIGAGGSGKSLPHISSRSLRRCAKLVIYLIKSIFHCVHGSLYEGEVRGGPPMLNHNNHLVETYLHVRTRGRFGEDECLHRRGFDCANCYRKAGRRSCCFPAGGNYGGGRQGGHIERSYEASIGTDRLSRS